MRLFIWALALPLFIASALGEGYEAASFPSYPAIPPLAKPWFKNIAQSFFYPDELIKLAKVPQAEPATTELMQRIINDPGGNPELLRYVIEAIKERNDFSADHQKWLRELLLSKLGQTKGFMESILKMYGPDIFAKYPSPANEELMIKYLGDKDVFHVVPGALDVGLSAGAMKVLGEIGTARAIKPLQKYAEIYKPDPGQEGSTVYLQTLESISAIQEREKQKADKASEAVPVMNENGPGAQKQRSKPSVELPETAAPLIWPGVMGAFAILILLWQAWTKYRK
jgi:hypothetical protein